MEARLDTPRKFYLLPSSLNLGLDGLLTLRVYKNDFSGQVTGSPFEAALVVDPAAIATLGIYEAGPVTFPANGTYHLVWECVSPSIKVTETVVVLDAPVGDFPTEFNQKARYETPGYTTQGDVVLRIIKDGEQVGSTYATSGSGVQGVYLTNDALSLSSAGVHLFVWSSATGGHAYTRIEQRLVLTAPILRTVTVFVMNGLSSPDVPVADVDVLISSEVPLQQTRTGTAGKAQFQLLDGTYIVSLRKSGVVFTRNNAVITVTATGDNTTYIMADPRTPTFDPGPLFDVSSTSLMLVDLVDGAGVAARGVRIFVSPELTISTKTGLSGVTGVGGDVMVAVTDGNGHAELRLLRGQTVTAAIEGSSFRRTFVVPAATSFRLLSVTPTEDDPLAVVVNTATVAERRS